MADELKYIEAKFEMLHNEILAGNNLINQKLDSLNEKVSKQNSRVGKLEDYKAHIDSDILPNRVTKEMLTACTGALDEKIECIDKKFEDVGFYLRHPKLFLAGIVFLVIITLATFLNDNPLKVFQKEPAETTQVLEK
ncbi:MAG TPA: hypothetical protein PK122_04840 [Candidatus Paceibacterota bacterium]|nr:hypothetical protein [Candidatus Paceibacterota bacterium]